MNSAANAISNGITSVAMKQLADVGIKTTDYEQYGITTQAGAEAVAEAIQRTGLTAEKFSEILNTAKGLRPDPSTYLKADYISSHLAKFEGGVTKITSTAPVGTAGPQGGTFIMPKTVADNIISNSGGSISKFEELLGLERGTLGTNPVRVDVSSPSGLRIPSGMNLEQIHLDTRGIHKQRNS